MNYDIDKMSLCELREFKKKVVNSMLSLADKMPLYEAIDARESNLLYDSVIIECSENIDFD